jgi:hypothetical protein
VRFLAFLRPDTKIIDDLKRTPEQGFSGCARPVIFAGYKIAEAFAQVIINFLSITGKSHDHLL